MQFSNLEDDDGDFGVNSTSRSRLSSLFQAEKASGDVNQALTFTAPKQPKKNDSTQNNPGTLKLVHATTVHAYKLIDGNYTNQGKLGIAILGLHETSVYKLLLYKGKQVQVSTSNIHQLFKFQVQPNLYATFYDEVNENWSIHFDSESELLTFTKQLAITKALSIDKNQPSLLIQDLQQGEGPSLDIGDRAEVKYTGWLLKNYSFGQIFDSNMQSDSSFRLQLGEKVIKGWSEGLIGAQKDTRRLLVVPPNLAYGSEGMGNAVPPNSTLIFEIIVNKVKKSRDSSHSPSPLKVVESVPEKKPEVLPRHSISSEDNIRLRGASISEQLTQSPKKDKAQLISRMAKMGTATLPFQGAIVAQVESDSGSEEETVREKSSPPVQLSGSRTSSPKPASKSTSRKNSGQLTAPPIQMPQSVQETSSYAMIQQPSSVPFFPQTMLPSQQSFPSPATVFPSFQQPIPNQYPMPQAQYSMHTVPGFVNPVTTSIADTHLPMLVSETRTQNTEVRLSLSKITEKVDSVIQKIDDMRLNQGRSGNLNHSSFMDSTLLLQSIEKIIQENSQLKEDVETKNSKIQSLNEKIYDLLQRNQRFFEESNTMLEQKSDILQASSTEIQSKLLSLEKEKAKLSSELSDALQKLRVSEAELESHQNLKSELSQKLHEGEKQLEELNSELSNFKKEIDSESDYVSVINNLNAEAKELSGERNVLSAQIKDWKEKYASLNEAFNEKTKELKVLQEQFDQSISDSKSSLKTESNEKIESLKTELRNMQSERKELVSKCQDLEAKLTESLQSESLLKKRVDTLEDELQKALAFKGKYENFYRKTLLMKENYEKEVQRLVDELKKAQSSVTSSSSPDFSREIKRVMNVLYKMLQGKFEATSSYSGTQVLETTLQTIRVLTMQMLQRKGDRSDTFSKEANSVKTIESTASNQANMNTTSENISLRVDEKTAKPTDKVLENGIPDETPMNTDILNEEIQQSSQTTENISEEISKTENHVSSKSEEVKETEVENNLTMAVSENPLLKTNSDSQEVSQEAKESSVRKNASNETPEKSKLASRVSPDHLKENLIDKPCIVRNVAWNAIYVVILLYIILWIGAWVHDLETTAPSSV